MERTWSSMTAGSYINEDHAEDEEPADKEDEEE